MSETIEPTSASPREVFERAHVHVRDYDLERFADMFASDGTLEFPFAPEGTPRRLEGRDQIRRVMAVAGQRARQSGRRITHYDPVLVHETTDPEVIVVEFDLHGEESTGSYTLSFIQVLRVRGGRIAEMRDYIDYGAIGGSTGKSPVRD